MIKIEQFSPDKDQLESDFYKKVYAQLDNSITATQSWNPMPLRTPSFSYRDVSKTYIENAKTIETWINPDEISHIHVKLLSDSERYLDIWMKNGQNYKVKGNSVQEFIMKNVIIGNDI